MCSHGGEFTGRTEVGSLFIWLTALFGFEGVITLGSLDGTSWQLFLVVEVRLWHGDVPRMTVSWT